jgi:hypothetical protein
VLVNNEYQSLRVVRHSFLSAAIPFYAEAVVGTRVYYGCNDKGWEFTLTPVYSYKECSYLYQYLLRLMNIHVKSLANPVGIFFEMTTP